MTPKLFTKTQRGWSLLCVAFYLLFYYLVSNSPNKVKKEPLLTLFTTWDDRTDLFRVRKITLRNWAMLKPYGIRPVLFSNVSAILQQAKAHGWDTMPITKTTIGVPLLKHMYLNIVNRFNSTLYCFANGDILFTTDLVESLRAILTTYFKNSPPLLVVGRRTNVDEVTEEETKTLEGVDKTGKKRGKLFVADAEDYFITDKKFPWADIPSLVVGRRAYDNYLVQNSIRNNYTVVDITETSLALHQTTTRGGNFEGHGYRNPDYNVRLLSKLYKKEIPYLSGSVDCTLWRTFIREGKIVVIKRLNRPSHC